MHRNSDPVSKIMMAVGAVVVAFAITTMAIGSATIKKADRDIAEADAWYEAHVIEPSEKRYADLEETEFNPVLAHATGAAEIETEEHEEPETRQYPWQLTYIAKVVGFEVGYCCDKCKYYVASTCYNRMVYWYDWDVIAMICDGNDEYYQMYPGYVDGDEYNDFNIWEHYETMLGYAVRAAKNAADIWYWDCDDTQGGWADLVWYCPDDDMYFYK